MRNHIPQGQGDVSSSLCESGVPPSEQKVRGGIPQTEGAQACLHNTVMGTRLYNRELRSSGQPVALRAAINTCSHPTCGCQDVCFDYFGEEGETRKDLAI